MITYNNAEFDYDGGDCLAMNVFNLTYPGCEVINLTKLGDGVCDEAPYISSKCRYDNVNCITVMSTL